MLSRNASKRSTHKTPALVQTAETAGPAAAPTDPAPRESTRPSDILIHRLHEVKRITKSLAAYFEGIAQAHHSHSKTLLNLSTSSAILTPFPESSLFLPTPVPEGQQAGWADLLRQIKDSTSVEAEGHLELGKLVQDEVVAPLKKLRVDIKAHIATLDKEVNKFADVVVKERDTSVGSLTQLSTSIAAYKSNPLGISAEEDPFVVRAAAEMQMRELVSKENELLSLALIWQDKTAAFEKGVFDTVGLCWKTWEAANSKLLAAAQKRSTTLASEVISITPDAEWNHFTKLNHLIPSTTPMRDLDLIEYPNRSDPSTLPIKQGVLERKKRFVKNWKSGFFVLTPAGFLHEYRSSDAPVDKPYLSLFLPASILGPLPTPEPSSNGRQKEAKFTIEERGTSASGGLHGSLGVRHREVTRQYRAKSWEEPKGWWEEIEKHTKSTLSTHAKVLADLQGPGPTAVQNAGVVAGTRAAGAAAGASTVGGGETSDEEIEEGSSDEELFDETRTKLTSTTEADRKEEETPDCVPLPGALSGAILDKKVKSGPVDDAVPPQGADLEPRPSTSKRTISETPLSTPLPASPTTSPTSSAINTKPIAGTTRSVRLAPSPATEIPTSPVGSPKVKPAVTSHAEAKNATPIAASFMRPAEATEPASGAGMVERGVEKMVESAPVKKEKKSKRMSILRFGRKGKSESA